MILIHGFAMDSNYPKMGYGLVFMACRSGGSYSMMRGKNSLMAVGGSELGLGRHA